MTRKTLAGAALSAIVMCALIPVPGHAQVASTPMPGPTRGSTLGFIGISNVRCNCTFRSDDDGNRSFAFRSNPVVLGIYEGSPADGALERGDTITAIDGYSLLSAEGGRRFANIRPGQRLTLNVSRGQAHMTLLLKATNIGSGNERAFGRNVPEKAGSTWSYYFSATPVTPVTPLIPLTPLTPLAPLAALAPVPAVAPVPPLPPSPTGWFGFSIRCNECGWSQGRGDDSPVWESSTPPELSMISSEGPAARAGLMAGDKITHVNGISILTSQGARAFGRARPGQRIRLTVLRDGESLTRELTLATRPELRAAIAATTPTPGLAPARRELRYTGQLDNVSVEVWSAAGPTVDRTADTITITVGTSVIRLKVK